MEADGSAILAIDRLQRKSRYIMQRHVDWLGPLRSRKATRERVERQQLASSASPVPAMELLRNCTDGFVCPACVCDLRRLASSTCRAMWAKQRGGGALAFGDWAVSLSPGATHLPCKKEFKIEAKLLQARRCH